MNITRELLDKIAHLARLEIKDDEAEKLMQDMNAIIAWIDKLKEVNTEGVEPLTSMSHELNSFREDVVQQELTKADALKNAPDHDGNHFRVPKVIE
ncbi:MAG: Asp-tRNA(Asn)/Glu-tRNA(Gln) amidotransferase subunit GatC [Cyclobacteriaceae bacterium]|nr:Asp-tRNA(Asn)/Glu-tRNA(Gln) amidotransferase subunit GatC [Cyclobacteriaceae bacterium]